MTVLALSLMLAVATLGADAPTANGRVVVVLVDGVRWQDVFDTEGSKFERKPAMPRLRKLAISEGTLWGDKGHGISARIISKVPYSLPGYQSIFAGQQTACVNNKCENVVVETFVDRFRKEGAKDGNDVAVFASWAGLGNAIATDRGAVHADIPAWGAAVVGLPWDNARWDSVTWTAAMAHRAAHDPRLLVISLLDTDEWAHAGHEDGYRTALVDADTRIGALVDDLKQRDLWKDTTLIVTTDHGRNANWRHHGDEDAGRDVFIGVFGRRAPRGLPLKNAVTHADVRPTVEEALGLSPRAGTGHSLLMAR